MKCLTLTLLGGATLSALPTAAVATPRSGFPVAFLGRWGGNLAGCSPGAVHGGLSISRRKVADGEFSGEVRTVNVERDGSIDVREVWDVPEEGLKTFVTNYRLTNGGNRLTTTDLKPARGKPDTFIRCKARHD